MTRKARLLFITAMLALGITLTGCGTNDDFNAWISGCVAEGGHVALMHSGSMSNHYECFKNDEIIQVPGWEGQN